ncbi:MAG: serine/threonine-protein kinase [Planctomycetota bacterium]
MPEQEPIPPAKTTATEEAPPPNPRPADSKPVAESLSGSRVESLSGSRPTTPSDSGSGLMAPAPTKPPVNDQDVGKFVTDSGLATATEVEYCREQQNNSSDPMQRSLADLLVENNFITSNQAKRIRHQIESRKSSRIPGYQLITEAGKGAMAKVYKAKQVSLDRIVAVKVLPKKVSDNADFVERFYREGQAAAKLSHNNIVQAIDVGSTPDGYHFFVMEWLEGPSLYDMMQAPPVGENKTFSEAEVIDIGIQMASALSHAHKRGMLHRDVKPKNIVLSPNGIAKLTDLGLARAKDDVKAAESEAGKAYGTPYYISPEQIRGEIDIDYRADIYSLGATLWHLAVGRPPYEGDSPSAVMHKHLKEPLTPPDHVNVVLGTGISEVIEVCMKKDRNERYQHTEDLLQDLRRVKDGEPPIHARRAVDFEALAEAEANAGQRTVDLNPVDQPNIWENPGVLAILGLGVVSILANLILVAIVLTG